jgi:DNA-binding beta-propeller fold protein YncE
MRVVVAAVLCLLSFPGAALAQACPGAEVCPYSSSSLIGQRAGGVLRFPQASAVGPDGAIYVADQYTRAIQVFTPDGRFLRDFGSGLTSVGAVAVAPDGVVYVADGSDRIDRYASDGRLLNSFGRSGSGAGEFHFGTGGGNDSGAGGGLAIGAGSLWVADTRNDRIQRFALDGSAPSIVVPPGRVKRPQGLAVSGGRLLVADDNNHRLAVFGLLGDFVGAVGSGPGPRPGQLAFPYDVAVDPLGRVFVADNINHRVVRYGPAPSYAYRGRWGSYGSRTGQLQYPRGLSVDAAGRTYVADPGGNRIDVFDVGGKPLRWFGSSGRVVGQFIRPLGVASDASGMRAVADSVNGRVQLLAPDGRVAAAFGAPAPGPTLLPDPVSVAFDDAGRLYVLDQERSRVLVFDRGGKIVRTIGSRGSGPGRLLSPSAVAVSGSTVYVADTGNQRIVRFGTGGGHIGAIGRFRTIRGVAVSPDGSTVYASDAGSNRISVLTSSGGDLAEIGVRELRSPAQLDVDEAGRVWVADRGNDRVVAYNPDGTVAAAFGRRGVGAGEFIEPAGVSVACNGLVTVSDADNNRVQQFQTGFGSGACASLPAITPPPDPILATQPDPVPPELLVQATRTSGLLAIRQFPLKVRADTPVRLAIEATLRPRSGKSRPTVRLSFSPISLPAGKTVTVRPRLSVAGVRRLAKALKGKRGLVAEYAVTASTEDSAPTLITRRLNVNG